MSPSISMSQGSSEQVTLGQRHTLSLREGSSRSWLEGDLGTKGIYCPGNESLTLRSRYANHLVGLDRQTPAWETVFRGTENTDPPRSRATGTEEPVCPPPPLRGHRDDSGRLKMIKVCLSSPERPLRWRLISSEPVSRAHSHTVSCEAPSVTIRG